MSPSDIPRILNSSEEKKVKRSIAKEASVAEKQVAQAGKALRSAENDEEKAEKAMQKTQQARDKAVKKEHSTAQVLSDAQHKHDLAVADERKAENDLSMCQKDVQEAHQATESRRTELEQAQRNKMSGDLARAESLRQAQRGSTVSGAAQPQAESKGPKPNM